MKCIQDLKELLISLCFWFLSFICSTFSIDSLKIDHSNGRFYWLLWRFSLHQASLVLLLPLSFYSHLPLLLFLAPLRIDRVSWQLVGHVPLNWSNVLSKFLHFTNYHVQVEMTGKRVNHGVGSGLENLPSWHSDVVTTLSQHRCWRCHNVVARSKMRVVPTSALRRCHNVATMSTQH